MTSILYTYIHIYTYIHTYSHTYIHIYIYNIIFYCNEKQISEANTLLLYSLSASPFTMIMGQQKILRLKRSSQLSTRISHIVHISTLNSVISLILRTGRSKQ
jgi:hypothetical protein